MNNLCKKVVVFLLVAILASSTCFTGVMAEEKTLADQIAALPEYKDFSSSADDGFDKAVEDAWQLIEELATLSDDDFYSLENASKAFDLYVGLTILKLREGFPTEIPTNKEELLQQYQKFYAVDNSRPELLPLLIEYTSPQEDSSLLVGGVWYQEFMTEFMEILGRFADLLITLTEEEQMEMEIEVMNWELEKFPETFTVENFWDYAYEFYTYYYGATPEDVPEIVYERIMGLQSSFDALVQNERAALIQELEKDIATVCDIEAVSSASELGIVYFHQIPCDVLFYNIDLLGSLCEEDASLLLSNYELFDEYYNLVNPEMDFMMYGDLDYDGEVNAKDALVALKITVDKIEATEDDLWVGDVDGDGDVSAKDALEILKYTVGKIEWFPVEDFEVELD